MKPVTVMMFQTDTTSILPLNTKGDPYNESVYMLVYGGFHCMHFIVFFIVPLFVFQRRNNA